MVKMWLGHVIIVPMSPTAPLHCPLAVAVLLLPLVVASAATDFDFFHHVQQVATISVARLLLQHKHKCHLLLPGRREAGGGKPVADFGIHGLRPEYTACQPDAVNPNKTSCWPDSCNATAPLDLSQIRDLDSDLRRNWGTLSCKNRDNFSVFKQHPGRRGRGDGLRRWWIKEL
ncbi:ribonuclease 3-like [Miscanthus floridulus]|uniref:ribonuclease 3-like n=1 Tax=Miscanthus floridulus TaxID=154761 RepID=UPI00345A7F02